jgi:hypothetical protein
MKKINPIKPVQCTNLFVRPLIPIVLKTSTNNLISPER